MTVYLCVQLKIKGRAAYARYEEDFLPVFEKFNGTLLAADFEPKVLDGEWDKDRIVLLSFPNEEELMAWITSDEYQAITANRDSGTDGIALLFQGIEDPR